MMPEATMTRSSLHAGSRCKGGTRLVHAALLHELPELGVGHVLHAVQAPGRLRGDLHVVPGARVRHERLEPVQTLPLLLRRCREPDLNTLSAPFALTNPLPLLWHCGHPLKPLSSPLHLHSSRSPFFVGAARSRRQSPQPLTLGKSALQVISRSCTAAVHPLPGQPGPPARRGPGNAERHGPGNAEPMRHSEPCMPLSGPHFAKPGQGHCPGGPSNSSAALSDTCMHAARQRSQRAGL